jgi:hypothetical protein
MIDTSDTPSHRRDQIANFAEILKNAPAKQKVFDAVYHGKKKSKTIGEIAKVTGYSPKRVAEIAHALARGEKLFEQDRAEHDGRRTTVYKKIPFVGTNKRRILSLARDGRQLERYHTKTNPKIKVNIRVPKGQQIKVNVPLQVRSKFIRVEDIAEFAKAKTITTIAGLSPPRLSEARTKAGFLKLLGETKTPKDWGAKIMTSSPTALRSLARRDEQRLH